MTFLEFELLEESLDSRLKERFRDLLEPTGEFKEFLPGEALEEGPRFRHVTDAFLCGYRFVRQGAACNPNEAVARRENSA